MDDTESDATAAATSSGSSKEGGGEGGEGEDKEGEGGTGGGSGGAPRFLGVVSEVFGPVRRPMYSVRLSNDGAARQLGLEKGTRVFCALPHSDFLVPR